ncbi:hypothetical protein [Bacillus amyloliquefaciens]|uniref:hypothetical protein n=1 Tax=Bacillus amyloliquefaciens TaxID=1390 RepID=UPI002DBD979E|nr:hypothetical protein [Bacillus amyloliquefaciens]MEC3840692.1 hypothetical protein [Bacillus amyloliquefaciens]
MEINWLDILLKGVPIVVSIGALFISTKVWLLNKKNISIINQPRFKIFRMYDPTNGIPDTYTFALNIEGNAPFYINEVEWISKDNHKVITDQYQDRLEIMNTQNSETKPHIVQYIKVKVQNSSKAVI